MKQLALDDLTYLPPPAVIRGDQRLWWCSQCGAVLIAMTGEKPVGACPSCDHTAWTPTQLPICGLHRGDTPPGWALDIEGAP